MNSKSFIAGLEELVARVVSLVLSILFFTVYTYATGVLSVNWQSMVTYLLLFWLLYEALSFILYTIFKFFGDGTTPNGLTIPVEDTPDAFPLNPEIQPEAQTKN